MPKIVTEGALISPKGPFWSIMELEECGDIIWIIIDDFVFLTRFSVNFWPFLASYGTLEPNISTGSEYLVSLLLLIHLYFILVKLEQLCDIIWIIIDVFFLSPRFAPLLTFCLFGVFS